ncbi:MAG: NAD(P)-dependent oxidoreductase [Chloroflexi bacterium]|nr:NAD(P)-dependent oxidoreductase [Chloroflexota bacterium]
MVQRVGFVGVGIMGEGMAANLLKAGFQVTVAAHRNREPVERLLAAGAREADSIAAVARDAEVVVTCVPNDAVVEEVLLGEGGVAEGAPQELIVVDTSTISPLTSQRLAGALAERGITMLDAPISGGQAGAAAGTLAIMVGGPREAFEQVRAVLDAMGKSITYVGDNGSALAVKLVNNLIVASTLVAVSEGFTMAAKAGVDPAVIQQVLAGATARSYVVQDKVPNSILKGNLQPGFKLELMHKDMGLALDFGKALKVPMFDTALVHQLFTQALGMGKGDLDCIAVSELYTEATGVSLKAREA